METITLNINKAEVWEEVAKISSYSGATSTEDSAYDRVFFTDANKDDLQRFFTDSAVVAEEQLKELLVDSKDTDKLYTLTIEVSKQYDASLTPGVITSLTSYFINSIISRWFLLANKAEVELYANESATMLLDALKKIYHRRRPTPPTRSNSKD